MSGRLGFAQLSVVPLLVFCDCFGPSPKELARKAAEDEARARAEELAAAELDPAKQKSIWDAEHVTFELEWRFVSGFKKALQERDAAGVRQRLREGFLGRMPPQTPASERSEQSSGVKEIVFRSPDDFELAADAFVAKVLAATESWSHIHSVGMRVLRIERLPDSEHRWRTEILLTQHGLRAGRQVQDKSENLIEWTILDDHELESGAVIDRWEATKRSVTEGDTQSLFYEATADAGLDKTAIPDNWTAKLEDTEQYRYGVAVEDFNRDGFLDIAVAIYDGAVLLFEGREGCKFSEVGRELGVKLDRPLRNNFLAAWIDINNDRYPDLLVGDRLFENVQGRQFRDITRESGLFIHEECMGATVADYDADGRLDIYFLYQRDWTGANANSAEKWVVEDESGKKNELWKNIGGKFVNVTDRAGVGGGLLHTQSAAWFFYDDDHLPDLYSANDFAKNKLLRNKGDGTFEDVSQSSGATGFATSMGVATGDLNNDGVSEIYVANMFSKMGRRIISQVDAADYPAGIYAQIQGSCAGNRLYSRSSARKPFQECGQLRGGSQVGWAFAPAFADFNNDGLLDIYSTTGFMSFKRGKPDG